MPKPPIELDAVDDIDPEALDLTDEAARDDDPPWSEGTAARLGDSWGVRPRARPGS